MTTRYDSPPAWVADAVFYQIFPDRFASSKAWPKPTNLEPWTAPPTYHGYKGGDLTGVIERLDWLEDLGINAIYFNPIFASGANHRYHTWDYFRIDPLLGDDAVFDRLITECHDRDIRIVLDGVFNHTGRGFFQFHDVLESGQQSPWADWYHIESFPVGAYDDRAPNYHAWWGLPALPKLNTENPDVREHLMRVAEHWVERGIDGWRLDVPQEITTEGFWEEFRQRTRAINPEIYIVGEIWDDASAWIGDGERFDGTMNYLFAGHTLSFTAGRRVPEDLAEGLNYPLRPPLDASGYGQMMEHLLGLYPWPTTLANLNLLDSHDVPRAMSLCANDADTLILAVVLQMTFPGAPSVYYGTEIGLPGGKDPDNRRAFPWDDEPSWNTAVLHAHRRLIGLRNTHEALRHGTYTVLPTDPGSMLYLFLRETDDERIVVALNAGDTAVSTLSQGGVGADFTTLWGDGGVAGDAHGLRVALAPRSSAIWLVT